MNINYFLEHYPQGKGFKIYDENNDGTGVYLIVDDSEIVYVGAGKSVKNRLNVHKSKFKFDEAYCWVIGNSNNPNMVSAAFANERHVIDYCNPILNNNKFIEFENRYKGGPQPLSFILGSTYSLRHEVEPKGQPKRSKLSNVAKSKGRPLKDASKGNKRDYCKTINIAVPLDILNEVNDVALVARGVSLTDYVNILIVKDLSRNKDKYRETINMMFDLEEKNG